MSDRTKRILTASHWGTYYAEVTDGRLTGVSPFEHDPEPSPLIGGMVDAVYSSRRVARPAIREGWLKHGPRDPGRNRGGDRFIEVSWDTALDLVAREIDRVRTDFGNEAIYGGSYGWASAGRFHHAKTQLGRFLAGAGGYTGSVGNYSMGAGMVVVPHILGSDQPIWGPMTGWDVLAENTSLFVCFGGLPQKNTQIEAGGLAEHRISGFLRQARSNGAEFVLISPMRSDIPQDLDGKWLSIVPNTDTALMLAIAHTLLAEGLHDETFLRDYTVGFDRFRPYLSGERDGLPKDPEWASAICGIPADEIRKLARRMAAGRTFISLSLSVQRSSHGEQTFWMGAVLAAMIGQIGIPGGGVGFGYSHVHGIGNPVARFTPPTLSSIPNPVSTYIPCARIADMLLHPGERFDYDGHELSYPDIRAIYWCGGNPMHHHQDLNRFLGALRAVETIIVHEPWWTSFARHADIVLPATTTLERNDVMATRRDRFMVAMKQVITPVGEARNDFAMFSDLAERLSFRTTITEGRDEEAWLRALYGASREANRVDGLEMPDFDRFWNEGFFRLPDSAGRYEMFADFRADPIRNRLGTPSGRIEIFSDRIAGFGYADCPGHPLWLEPAEWLGSTKAHRHPLHLLSNQPRFRLHSQLDNTAVGRTQKVDGREPVFIHPHDAAERNLADGDTVRVFNDRGACLAGVRLTEDVRPGVVVIPTGAWYEPQEPGCVGTLELNGNPNVLTLDLGTSRLAQATSAQTALVEIQIWGG
ncbi:MAG: molybdopterin-dependent oxidoreductase [Rhizobiaceae bacterium]